MNDDTDDDYVETKTILLARSRIIEFIIMLLIPTSLLKS